jgi:CO/xanthine dehydrogenase Mo-binding subunit
MGDTPCITPIVVECASESGLHGIKGVGEPPVIFSAAAIANAIYNATGVQLTATPFTPERVYRALKGHI